MVLLIGSVLFARNSLKGQPKLQQRLVKLAVYTALGSDVGLLQPRAKSPLIPVAVVASLSILLTSGEY